MSQTSILPGQPWHDIGGDRIQAHGGSMLYIDGVFYWYGENKARTDSALNIWHWGVRAYRSIDLYNWTDCGLIIPPDPDDPLSPMHPAASMDRPHIIHDVERGRFVCWIKVMRGATQLSSVFVSEHILGPYTQVKSDLKPLGMYAGDFDLVVDPRDGKGYYFFERPHSELICADLTDDYTDLSGYYSTHFPRRQPPFVREAPAHFFRNGLHYLVTSGTTSYYPNPSEISVAETYHGPWSVQGDAHPDDTSRTSYRSQISCVFKHPAKKDLYIALADRWLPHYLESGAAAWDLHERLFRPGGGNVQAQPEPELTNFDTRLADYVWLPLQFDGDRAWLEWRDEWRIEEFEDETSDECSNNGNQFRESAERRKLK